MAEKTQQGTWEGISRTREGMTRRRVRRVAESTIQHGMEGMGR
jgi:hypothetical protein